MKAEELNGTHIGHKMTVNSKDIATAGTLRSVEHEGGLIADRPMFTPYENYAVGRRTVLLTFLPDSIIRVEPAAEVELLD